MSFIYVSKNVGHGQKTAPVDNVGQTSASGSNGTTGVASEPNFFSDIQKFLDKEAAFARAFKSFKRRGPTSSSYVELHTPLEVRLGFHRLGIINPTPNGDQPFREHYPKPQSSPCDDIETYKHTAYVVCNGEIYNFKQVLGNPFDNFKVLGSDCEVILHLYTQLGIKAVIKQISGEFAFIIVDVDHEEHSLTVHAARDPMGVKPLFWAKDEAGFALCSELKGLVGIVRHADVFPPGFLMSARFAITEHATVSEPEIRRVQFYTSNYPIGPPVEPSKMQQIYAEIREIFIACVRERLIQSDSSTLFGVLLSGGLDSSLVAAIAAQELKNQKLQTFTIGMPRSPDMEFAQSVANHIKSEHHKVIMQEDDFLKAISEVVYAVESYDITTVRASAGQFLISKYISTNHPEIKVRHTISIFTIRLKIDWNFLQSAIRAI